MNELAGHCLGGWRRVGARLCLGLAIGLATAGLPVATATEIWTTLPPLAWLVEQIGGEKLAVQPFIGQGQDPHTFAPRPRAMMALQGAKLLVTTNADFETTIVGKLRAMYPNLKILDLSPVLAAGGEAAVEPGNNDPHVWLSLRHLAAFAPLIRDGLADFYPSERERFADNCQRLRQRLEQADAEYARRLAPHRGRAFYVHHPAFGFFARDYGLIQKAVEIEGKDPSPRQLLAVIEAARQEQVKVVIASPQFADRSARILAERIGGQVVKVDPLAPDTIVVVGQLVEAIAGPPAAE